MSAFQNSFVYGNFNKNSIKVAKSQKFLLLFVGLIFGLLSMGSAQALPRNEKGPDLKPLLYAYRGKEVIVEFKTESVSRYTKLEEVKALNEYEKDNYKEYYLVPLVKYLFGPTTHRSIAGIKSVLSLDIDWNAAYLEKGRVVLPYKYQGVWLIDDSIVDRGYLNLPVPRNEKALFSEDWKECTDSDPEHQTESFYWYFWDPERFGCDHREGEHYDVVKIEFRARTTSTSLTFPEYNKMIKVENGSKVIKATFAFGYVTDLTQPNPDKDSDIGVAQYRRFINEIKTLLGNDYKAEDIFLSDYKDKLYYPKLLVIGKKFRFVRAGVNFELKVVSNALVDQMDLFARSFAHDHDSYFAWLGHSRVGSGFDAQIFRQMLFMKPEFYSISQEYQLVFWGGCNSYSYYAEPFFKVKSDKLGEADPNGTKSLDIIANALPSLFILNAKFALIQLKALLNFDKPTSYQEIIKQMEVEASRVGTKTLSVVLGDEDNNQSH